VAVESAVAVTVESAVAVTVESAVAVAVTIAAAATDAMVTAEVTVAVTNVSSGSLRKDALNLSNEKDFLIKDQRFLFFSQPGPKLIGFEDCTVS
jgi:hypothetical protein